ncbi:SUMF1/EgtB/PvdO family nonheme iron enzyme [Maridesulfovibrio bastinii]|uniref:SUMF1/EgtB/PvdO family nonheme iron enzyme n=1 Tax=Maridesulfovibrio bastinii TaxID=47157 RepID=UPI000410033D|nr:SUMF1/EgtB/PvdO family nonheme iron enzyme [Maridesulfovibrio bastinii]
MKRIGLLVFFLVLAISGSALAAGRVALVIGNGRYADSPLRNPVNDASDMAAKLRGLGFDVTLLTDAGQKKMERSIRDFGSKLARADIRLFYYAGHGMQVQGANYLIPVDADVATEYDVKYEAVNANRVLDGMSAAGKGVNILILDACRNNPFARSFRSASRGLTRMDAPRGTVVVYATALGDVAADGSGRNGVFTKNLLANIDKKGLTLEQVFKRAGKGVVRETNGSQEPWISLSLYDDIFLAGQTMVAYGSTYGAPASQPATMGSLRIESQPDGAQIFLNGNRVGRTPKSLNGLPVGRVTLEARLDGYEPQEKITTVLGGQSVHVGFALTQARAEVKPERLYVLPNPTDATIKILNIGPKYTRGMSLAPGKYHVEASKSGYGKVRQWVGLRAGQDLDVPVTLEKATVAEAAAPAPRPSSSTPGKTWRDPTTGIEFVWVPGGCFQMGSNSGGKDEKPVHEVCVDGFWLGKYEVTQAEWQRVMGNNPSHFKGDRNPVETVSWNDAQEFIKRMNAKGNGTFRLPTEAEWEYAARSGGRDETYAGGNDVDRVAWYNGNSGKKTHPVGTKAPNGLGLYDMSGNVCEWCQDWYNKNAYSQHSRQNPIYSGGGFDRVYRGGGWSSYAWGVRAANRCWIDPDCRNDDLGFRLLRTN